MLYPVFNFFNHLAYDLYLAATDLDDIAQAERDKRMEALLLPVTETFLTDRKIRILSIAARIFGAYLLLHAFLVLNPILGKYRNKDFDHALFRLAAAGVLTVMGHDFIAVGTATVKLLDVTNFRDITLNREGAEKVISIGLFVLAGAKDIFQGNDPLDFGMYTQVVHQTAQEVTKETLFFKHIYSHYGPYLIEKFVIQD